jgi:SM-20-related protein
VTTADPARGPHEVSGAPPRNDATGDAAAPAAVDAIVAGLVGGGCARVRDFLAPEAIAALRNEALHRDAAGDLAAAGVGRGAERAQRSGVRGDRILWLEAGDPQPAERALWSALDTLKGAINRELMLGLWSVDCHYAVYPPGAFYARHRDIFRDAAGRTGERVVSCVLYLNEGWRADDGGALRIHRTGGAPIDVSPEGGTLAAFLSERFEHEVLPSTRPRLAVTGWFRRR